MSENEASDVILYATAVGSLLMALAIGAQDVSNALGTSVGSKALTINQAIVVGAVFEFLGSLMGSGVASTISHNIVSTDHITDPALFENLMFCTLAGSFLWLAVATCFSLPVSTSHSLVGSIFGLAVLILPREAVNMRLLTTIAISWLTSPLMGLSVSFAVFWVINAVVLKNSNPYLKSIKAIPFFYGGTFGILTLFLILAGPKAIRSDIGGGCIIASGVGLAMAHLSKYAPSRRPKLKADNTLFVGNSVLEQQNMSVPKRIAPSAKFKSRDLHGSRKVARAEVVEEENVLPDFNVEVDAEEENAGEIEKAERLFSELMVVTACVVAFAHGSNDVSNAIGPFAAVLETSRLRKGIVTDSDDSVPFYALVAGGIGIVIGLWAYGYKCMSTIGEKITKLTFTRGFAAQIGTAATVLTATIMGLSVSTTHCLIGAIAGVALVESSSKINMQTIKKIGVSWLVTIPASALFSLLVFLLLALLTGQDEVVFGIYETPR